MKPEKLRDELRKCNLSRLERLCSVPARTLRRIRNGADPVRDKTVEAIVPHLKAARLAKNENELRADLARQTREFRAK